MNVLITGGAGFIGSRVCMYLISEGVRVVNLDKLTYAAAPSSLASIKSNPLYSFVRGDIGDRDLVGKVLVEHEIDTVLNLAAESHVDRSITGPAAFIETNIVGTFNLLQSALAYHRGLDEKRRAGFRFLHVSTDEVYGTLDANGAFSEDTPYDPRSPYSASKASSDHLCMAYHHTYGLPVLITNCSNNYGPNQFPEKLIPLMILKAMNHEPLPVYGRGENIRDWLHVDDHARAIWLVAQHGRVGETYNVGGNAERQNIEVVTQICEMLEAKNVPAPEGGFKSLITFTEDRPGHDFRYAIDCSKLQSELGWAPLYGFRSGLSETIDWYLNNESWWKPIQERVYDGARLGFPG